MFIYGELIHNNLYNTTRRYFHCMHIYLIGLCQQDCNVLGTFLNCVPIMFPKAG